MKTQLIFTVIPGPDGNLKWQEFESVLSLARNYGVMVNVNPVFGVNQFSPEELEILLWFARQADVQMSRGKLRFLLRGGNNVEHPTCRAMLATITIAPDGRIVLPCFHQRTESLDLRKGLESALLSPVRTRLLKLDGRFSFCQGCTIWCYIVPSMACLRHVFDRTFVWMHGLSGLQRPRDCVLRLCGSLHPRHTYPDFRSPHS